MRPSVLVLTGLILAGCGGSPELRAPEPGPAEPERIILFIGDGVGTAYWTAARSAAGTLAVERMPVTGLVATAASNSRITDSAAGATAYAAGVKTYNGAIGVDPDGEPVRTILEMAEERGMATGLVATSSITHATPASFAAHVESRRMESEIARQMAQQEIEVLLGGGRSFFDGTAEGASDLMPALRDRYTVVETAAELRSLRAGETRRLLGLFAEGGMPPQARRSPGLEAMTSAALAVLEGDEDGMFLMVESSQPDWRGHDNAPLDEIVAEMLEFDRAIAEALTFQRRHPGTVIVVTADHETGGLALELDQDGELVADYTTSGHSGTMIPLFASGPGSERFGGLLENDEVGRRLIALLAN